jgi:hypothetical protein
MNMEPNVGQCLESLRSLVGQIQLRRSQVRAGFRVGSFDGPKQALTLEEEVRKAPGRCH